MGKVLAFIYDDMADFETTFAIHLLGSDAGKEIIPIAYENRPVKSRSGMMYQPKATVKDVVNEEVEGLIIPGGWNGELREELVELIRNLNKKEKLLAAICAGPNFLARAGVLKGRKYTTTIREWTEDHARRMCKDDPFERENFVDERVVRDGNIITAIGLAFVDFAVEICEYFNLFDGSEDRRQFEQMIFGRKSND